MRLQELDSLRVTDKYGIVKYGPGIPIGSKIDVSDRPYFKYLSAHNDEQLHISAPRIARINKKWVLPIMRRINHPDGSFAGLVIALVSLEKIHEAFAQLNVGGHGVVNLRDGDLNMIMRYPAPQDLGSIVGTNTLTPELQAALQVNKEFGIYRVHAVIDHIERTYSYQKLTGLPLYVTVGFASDDYLAEWQEFSTKLVGLTLLLILISSGAAWFINRGEKRRLQVVQDLYQLDRDFITLLENTTDFIYFKDKDSRIRFCSQTLADITGHKHWREMIGKHDSEIFPEETARIYAEEELPLFRDGIPLLNRIDPYYDEQGAQGWVSTNKWPVFDPDEKTVIGLFGISRDVTELKRADERLKLAASVFTNSREGILITDANSTIIDVNEAFTRITGYSREDALGKNPRFLSSGRQDKEYYEKMWRDLVAQGHWYGEIWNRRKNGEVFAEMQIISAVYDANNNVQQYVAQFSDITSRKTAEDEIKTLAFYDSLTGLPNRRLLTDRLKWALATSARTNKQGAILFIDLDNFKTLNDTLGHDIGDLLLQQVAKRLELCVREGDTVARLGGDEFVVMLEDLSEDDMEAASKTESVGNKILSSLQQAYQLDGHEQLNTPSIGAALFSDHQVGLEELFKQADIAMYQAKKAGRNQLRFFNPEMQHAINLRASLERELSKALELHQFQLYFQTQVDQSLHPVGAEVLIRWINPSRGLVPPDQFIHLMEESGLILPVGTWVLRTACEQLKRWHQDALTSHLTLAVNVSAKQFRQWDFVAQVKVILAETGANPSRLKLELTESMLVENIADTIVSMEALRAIGVRFSLDDFGTGYSSLQYLKKLPLDQLKIDQSFVRDINSDSSNSAIVRTIIAMAGSLNLDVIAEGVETDEQRQALLDNGCIQYQGYLIGRPVPIDQFEVLLNKF
jgi:diguanylate cyclase (GGDEF)-like protein/PAS domain S-box-containing protein